MMNSRTKKHTFRSLPYIGAEDLALRPFFQSQNKSKNPTKAHKSRNRKRRQSAYDIALFKQEFTPLDNEQTLHINITDAQGDRPAESPSAPRISRSRASRSRSAHPPFGTNNRITSNGRGSRKRPAEDTELELVAANHDISTTQGPVVISRRGQTDLEDTNQTTATPSMLEDIPYIGSFTRMIFNFSANLGATFTGLKETWRRYRTGQPYNIAEFREYINNNQISNKRLKLDRDPTQAVVAPQEPVRNDGRLRWVGTDELVPLRNQFTTLESRLRITTQLITDFPSRQAMFKILEPITDILTEHSSQTGNDLDLCKLFHLRWQETFDFLRQLYNLDLIIRIRNKFEFVPAELDLCHTEDQTDMARRVKKLLSAPSMIAICNQILHLAHEPNVIADAKDVNLDLSKSFIDQVILDLNAVIRKVPPPSYVKNTEYRDKLEKAFSHEGESSTLPGTFPENDQSQSAPQQEATPELEAAPQIEVAPEQPTWEPEAIPLPPSPPHTLTRQELSDDETRRLIRESFITEFQARPPLNTSDAVTVKSILKKKLHTGSSRFSPKRLMRRYSKAVRFTDDTWSPKPRSHKGTEISQSRRRNPYVGLIRPFQEKPTLQPPPDSIFRHTFDFPPRPSPVKVDHDAKIREIFDIPSLPLEISDTSRASIEYRKEQEQRRIEEEARKAKEEQRRIAEEKARLEREERLAKSGGLRVPNQRFVSPLSIEWQTRARDTLRAAPTTTLAKTAEGIDLRRHDFAKVVTPTEWLNDEIVNGSLIWLDQAINSAAGIKDVKKNTRKCLAMSSFFFKRLQDTGVAGTQRTLRRSGVEKRNFLDVDTILLPICERSHWTLIVVRPSKRTIAHMDSLNPRGSAAYTNLTLAWVKNVLEEKFQPEEWKILRHEAPMQTNGHDCGVHTITNGICIALGLSPIDCYSAEQMPQQRLRIASMLLNGGFKEDFDLRVY